MVDLIPPHPAQAVYFYIGTSFVQGQFDKLTELETQKMAHILYEFQERESTNKQRIKKNDLSKHTQDLVCNGILRLIVRRGGRGGHTCWMEIFSLVQI